MRASVWAVVVAAGEGSRFGRAKQFEKLNGRLVVDWAVVAARSVAERVVLVVPAAQLEEPSVHAGADAVVAGGASRSESVRAGLAVVPLEVEVVVVHDAARPLATPALFRSVTDAVLAGAEGAVPGLVVHDTVKRVVDGQVLETVPREGLVTVQTPQAFAAPVLRRAHATRPVASDDAALLERIGSSVVIVSGEPMNVKLTEGSDMDLLSAFSFEGVEQRP